MSVLTMRCTELYRTSRIQQATTSALQLCRVCVQWGYLTFGLALRATYLTFLFAFYMSSAAFNICMFLAPPLGAPLLAGIALYVMNTLMYVGAAAAGATAMPTRLVCRTLWMQC
jgi:hypothetical protein